MTRIALATASALALTLGACATTDDDYVVAQTTTTTNTQTLSDAQQIGVADNDAYMSTGAEQKLDDKFRVDCNDNDRFEATGCDDAMMTKTTTTVLKSAEAMPVMSALEMIYESPEHEKLEAALRASGLVDDILALDGGYTIFAPTDAAFERVGDGAITDSVQLEEVLRNHIIPGRYLALDVLEVIPTSGSYAIPTFGGGTVTAYRTAPDMFKLMTVDNLLVPVATADLIGNDGGVVHIIDTVLVPYDEEFGDKGNDPFDKDMG